MFLVGLVAFQTQTVGQTLIAPVLYLLVGTLLHAHVQKGRKQGRLSFLAAS